MKRLIVISGAVLLALAGCTPGTGASTSGSASAPSTPSASESASATPTPGPSATVVVGKPALGDLVATPHGIGDLQLGHPVPQSDPALFVRFDATACVPAGLTEGQPYAGLWDADYPDYTPIDSTPAPPFTLLTEDGTKSGPVARIRILGGIRSSAGVGVDDSLAQLQAAYPGGFFQTVPGDQGTDLYAVGDDSGVLTFEVAVGSDAGWTPAQLGHIVEMNIFAPAGNPLHPWVNTLSEAFCPD